MLSISQTSLLICVMLIEALGLSFRTHIKTHLLRRKMDTYGLVTSKPTPRAPSDPTQDYSPAGHLDVGLSGPVGPLRSARLAQGPNTKPNDKDAKGFWNHFLFRKQPDFQSVLPIQYNEVRQERCRTIPFLQRIAHEDCEPQLLKNNVCFGKCDMQRTNDSTSCLLCSPVKLIHTVVQLKCKDSGEVTKDIKIVEECQCKEHGGRNVVTQGGPVLMDPSIGH